MHPRVLVNLTRAALVLICCLLGIAFAVGIAGSPDAAAYGAIGGTVFGLLCVGLDKLLGKVTIRGFSSATFGLLIGLLCAWLITRIGLLDIKVLQDEVWGPQVERMFELALYIGLGFLGITLAVRSDREEFSFIIPYVRFRRDATQDNQPLLLDTNIIIDGRVPGIAEAGFVRGHVIVPRFVIDELHRLADSRDAIKQERGKHGLDALTVLRNETPSLEVSIYEDALGEGEAVDAKLVALAHDIDARILSNDRNLAKVAELSGVHVLNLNQLATALSPQLLPGEQVELELVKTGREDHQAVGYLADGTMVIVNGAVEKVGETVDVVVSSAVQTSNGRLIFADLGKGE